MFPDFWLTWRNWYVTEHISPIRVYNLFQTLDDI
jgi:hypothetical protein